MTNPSSAPEASIHNLAPIRTPYPGRFVAAGVSLDGQIIGITAIGGRSDSSRDRMYVNYDGLGTIGTKTVSGKAVSPEVIYPSMAMSPHQTVLVFSNGQQTSALCDGMSANIETAAILRKWDVEIDGITPRISATVDLRTVKIGGDMPRICLSLVGRSQVDPSKSERRHYENPVYPGTGWGLVTYDGAIADPLIPYSGHAFAIPLNKTPEEMLLEYWELLNPETRVAIALRAYDPDDLSYVTIVKNGDAEMQYLKDYSPGD